MSDHSELAYQDMLDDDEKGSPPQFPENDLWPTTTRGLPLKARFLQLTCGSDDNEDEQYYHVIDHWTTEVDEYLSINHPPHNLERRFRIGNNNFIFSIVNTRRVVKGVGQRRSNCE